MTIKTIIGSWPKMLEIESFKSRSHLRADKAIASQKQSKEFQLLVFVAMC